MNKKNLTTPDAEAVAQNTLRRPLIVLLSVFVALCLLTSALAVLTFVDFSDDGKDTPQSTTQGFDYYSALLSDYLTYTESTFKGLTLPGFESRIDDVTEANVKKYINQLLLSKVALSEDTVNNGNYFPKYTEAIDYADEVFLYVVRVDKDGERVDINYFENAYMETGRIQIGMAHFGEAFDDALCGLVPAEECYFETRATGAFDEDDVILLSYTVTETVKSTDKDKENEVKNHKNFSGERIDLAEKDAAWTKLLIDNAKVVGQYFTFEYEEDIDEDGEKEKVKYEGMVDAVVEDEHTYTFEAKLPEDYFGKAPSDERFAALNGAKLTFTVSVAYIVPHNANTADTLTLGDIATLNEELKTNGVEPFVPSNNKTASAKEDGALTKASKALSTLRGEIKTLKGEIETLERGDVATLTKEIADLEAEIAELAAAEGDNAELIASLTADLNKKQDTLEKQEKTLSEKKSALVEKEAKLDTDEAAYEEELKTARTECLAFFTDELEKTYEESVKYAAGGVVFNHLLETLEFKKLPEEPLEQYKQYLTETVEYYYSMLSDADKRDYRDIHAYAANYFFGYDEKEYETYTEYINEELAPSSIKQSLLQFGIYSAFINDEAKLNAEIDDFLTEYVKVVKISSGETVSKDDVKAYFAQQNGATYLRDTAIYELVLDFLAENNTIDWDAAKNQEKN